VKALTLIQPRATLVALGALRVETRPEGTDYRGELAIHAAWTLPPFHQGLAEQEPAWSILRSRSIDPYALPRRRVVALAELVEVRACTLRSPPHAPVDALERLLCEWRPGLYLWRFANVRRVEEPIPAQGRPGLWEWRAPEWLRERVQPK